MATTERINFRQVRDFSEVFNAAFAFTRQNFKPLGKAILFIAGPLILIQGILTGLTQADSLLVPANVLTGGFWAQYGVLILAALLGAVMVTGVVCEYVMLYINKPEGEITIEEVWQGLKRDFGMFFWTTILAALLIVVGAMLCILPGVYLFITLTPILILRLNENLDFGEAMTRCRELIRDYWWTAFGLIFIAYLVVYAVVFVFQLPQTVLTLAVTFHAIDASEESLRPVFMITSILASFSGMISYAFPELVACLLYFSLVEHKEATGLMGRIDQIGTGNS